MPTTTIRHPIIRYPALAAAIFGTVNAAIAQDSGALLTALIRKGILSNQDAQEIRAELRREGNTVPAHAFAGGKHTDRLSIGMRMQAQYANIDADVRGAPTGPPATDRAFLRRMYFTLKAGLGVNWGAQFTYDFAGGSYDDAIVFWNPDADLTFDFGLRKVNVGYEERRTSGDLRAIERSGVTRYFVEPNNGRRLGAASYRIGAFLDGRKKLQPGLGFVYGAAITTPERNETFALASSSGDSTNNRAAYWANVALTGKLAAENSSWLAGAAAGLLPDQGGSGPSNLGRGHDLALFSVHTDITVGRFSLLAEYLAARVEAGRPNARTAWPHGFFIQPGIRFRKRLEAVVRYQSLDTDKRGLTLADVIRSAPGGGTMNTFTEWYAGLNWYLHGDDLKFQTGGFHGETKDTVTGGLAQATVAGIRSQVQMQF